MQCTQGTERDMTINHGLNITLYTHVTIFLPFSSCGNCFCSHCSCCHATKYRSYILSWLNTAIFSCLLYIVTEFLYIVILRMTTMQHEMMALFVVYFFRQHYVFFCYVCSMFAGILWQTDGVWNLLLISFVCHWCLDNFVARNNNCVHSILCACSGWTRIFKIGDGKRYAFAFFLVWTANNVIPQ